MEKVTKVIEFLKKAGKLINIIVNGYNKFTGKKHDSVKPEIK